MKNLKHQCIIFGDLECDYIAAENEPYGEIEIVICMDGQTVRVPVKFCPGCGLKSVRLD